ncbi:restriction endonuclease subunit S [Polaribacter sp.]|nr:restriction endonuclease subunit S [Polaribacter sp.]
MIEWKEIRNGCAFVSGYAFKGSDFNTKNIGKPIVKIKNIQNDFVTLESSQYISDELLNDYNKSIEKFLVGNEEILIAMTGAGSVGRVGLTNFKGTAFLNQRVGKFMADEVNLNKEYLFNVLTSLYFKKFLYIKGQGSGQPNLSPNDILDVKIPFPAYKEQKEIGKILQLLVKKIILLKEQNLTIEATSKAVFTEWFGRYQLGDELPKGWTAKKLVEIGESIRGKVKNEEGRVVLSAISTGKLIPSDEYFTKQVYSKSLSNYIICNPGDFAYNPARINIGSIGRNNLNVNGAVSPVYVVYRTSKIYGRYIEFLLKSKKFDKHVGKFANGSVRQSLNYEGFAEFTILIPSESMLNKFYSLIDVLDYKIISNNEQIQSLTKTRDTLLPKLMSGQVRVNNIKQIEDA